VLVQFLRSKLHNEYISRCQSILSAENERDGMLFREIIQCERELFQVDPVPDFLWLTLESNLLHISSFPSASYLPERTQIRNTKKTRCTLSEVVVRGNKDGAEPSAGNRAPTITDAGGVGLKKDCKTVHMLI
jgi:hypothetical protein